MRVVILSIVIVFHPIEEFTAGATNFTNCSSEAIREIRVIHGFCSEVIEVAFNFNDDSELRKHNKRISQQKIST